MRSKKRTLIIISIAVALLLSAGAISFAAWSVVGSSVGAAGVTGSISYISGMTVTSPDGKNNEEQTSITMTKPLYPVDHKGSGQNYWKFELSADISGQLDTLYTISGSLKQGERTLPAGSAQLYWSEFEPSATEQTSSHAFGSGKSYLRDLTVTGDTAAATLYVYMEAFSTEVMNANVVLEFGIVAAQSMTLTVLGHKMGDEKGLSGNVTLTNKSNADDTFNVTLTDGEAKVKVFAPAEYEVIYDDSKDYNSGRIECAANATAANVTLEYKRFDMWLGWDGADHDMSKVNNIDPEIGVNNTKTLNVISRDSYDDVAVTLWMKKSNSTHVWDVQGLVLKFEDHIKDNKNHQYMFLHSQKSQFSDQYQLLWGGNFDGTGKWMDKPMWTAVEESNVFIEPFTAEQSNEFASSDGLRVTIVRRGATLLTYIGDGKTLVQSGIMVLPREYADDKVKVGFWDYDSKVNATWKFDITEDIYTIDSVNLPKEFVVPDGSKYGNGSLSFYKKAGEKYKFGEGAEITVKSNEGYIMGSLTVSGKPVELDVKDNVYSFAVLDDISSVRVTFIPNEALNAVKFNIPANANTNGMKFTLYREINGETVTKSGTVADNSFTLYDIMPGRWNAKTTVYGVDAYLKGVYVGSDNVNVEMTGVFGSPEAINFGNDKVFNDGIRVRYTIPADISGDAYFGMKLKSTTDTTKIKDDDARFGLRMFYAGDNGYDNELSVTLVVKSGKWKLQTCGKAYDEVDITDYNTALKGDGVYMAVVRRESTGNVHVYMGENKTVGNGEKNLKEIAVFSSEAETSQKNIIRFGAAFWGGTFNATVSDLMYSDTSLNATLGIEATEQNVILTVKGRKNGEIVDLNGQIKLTSPLDSIERIVTLNDGTATVTLKTPLTYKVTFIDNNNDNNQYYDGALTLANGDTAATVTLEYKRFGLWGGLDAEKHDFSKVNDSHPVIGNNGGNLNVITRDTYGDVAVSLWMKSGNSEQHNGINSGMQGIFFKFSDGKYMYLRMLRNEDGSNNQHRFQWSKEVGGGADWNFAGATVIDPLWSECGNGEYETQLNSTDGVKVTVVRISHELHLYLNDNKIDNKTMTLDGGYDAKTVQVGFWAIQSKANATWKFDIQSLDNCSNQDVALTVNGHKAGQTNALNGQATLTNIYDSTDTHTVTLVNGKATETVSLKTPASYRVHFGTATQSDYYDGVIELAKGATMATVVLEYRRFDLWVNAWEKQHDFSKTNNVQPVIGADGKTLNVITRDTYGDVAASLWIKKGNTTHIQDIQGIFVKFGDGKYMFFRCEQLTTNGQPTGKYKLQWAMNFDGEADKEWSGVSVGSVIQEWKDVVLPLSDEQDTKFESDEGLKVTLVRRKNSLYIYVDDKLIEGGTVTLPDTAYYSEGAVQVGFWDYDSKANATWRFDITETLPNDLPVEQA